MTEKLDRKQLKLKKYDAVKKVVHGLLYKSKDWCYETFMGHESGDKTYPGTDPESYTNTLGKERWTSFEQKYPDYEKEAVEWEPLYNAVKYVAKSTASYVNFQEKAVKTVSTIPWCATTISSLNSSLPLIIMVRICSTMCMTMKVRAR